jgi:hypothetical protein
LIKWQNRAELFAVFCASLHIQSYSYFSQFKSGEGMKNNKLSLFWGLIVIENFDFQKDKFIARLLIIVVTVFILFMCINTAIKLYVVW